MSMTPDKTLEEQCAEAICESFRKAFLDFGIKWSPGSSKETILEWINHCTQSATAAKQREVERLSEQLRTERERVKEAGALLGKWMDSYAYGIPQHDINVATYGFMKEPALSHSGKDGV